jgi:hypothetical protein
VVAKVRERLAVSKETTHGDHMERFILKKLSKVEGKERYRVEISNRFSASFIEPCFILLQITIT